MASDVRFFDSGVGGRIAYAVEGSGPPLVELPPWSTHLIAEEALSGHRAFIGTLAREHTVVRYDRWGTGLSSRQRDDFSLARELDALTGLVDNLRLRRFVLVGPSHGAPLAVSSLTGSRAGSRTSCCTARGRPH